MLYLRHSEDCSLGDSTDSLEKLRQEDSAGGQYMTFLVKREFNAIKHLSYKRFSAGHEEVMSPVRD